MSTTGVEWERYIIEEPQFESNREVYSRAAQELLVPFPSVELKSFPKLSKITGGFRPREFSILCGATGIGKTTLLANLSRSLILDRVPHFVASVETGRTDFFKRVMASLSGEDWNLGDAIPLEKLKAFHLEHSKWLREEIFYLSLYENRFSVETLMSDIAWMVRNKAVKIAMIDNLNFFMDVRRSADQVIEMDRVIHELIIFCKQVDVHIVMVMHPKKTDGGRVESEFDVKGSSTAVQEAHNVFLFNRPHPDLIESGTATKNDREFKIAKMRRRGKYVGSRLIFECGDGVSYREGARV